MDFEGLEQFRAETTKKAMEALATIVADTKVNVTERIAAAKALDSMSDSIIAAYLKTRIVDTAEGSSKRLSKQVDKLLDKVEDEE